jgi:hypothetical protein
MNSRTPMTRRLAAASAVALVAGMLTATPAHAAEFEVIASGLNNPRQLAFAPGGTLYVAEAGVRGDSQDCSEHPDLGEFCLEFNGSLARVGRSGDVKRVVTGLPSISSDAETMGPFDIAFTGKHRFALTIGLGGDNAFRKGFRKGALLGTVVTGNLHRHKGAKVRKAFDALAFEAANNPDKTDIDSNPTGIVKSGRGYVFTDSGGNSLVSTRRGGSALATFKPVLTTQPVPGPPPVPVGFPADAVPTDVVVGPDGARYVSQLVGFPFEKGSSTIWRVVRGRDPEPYATGLTNVTSLAFAKDGTLYAVELASNGLLTGPVGALVKVEAGANSHEPVASDLPAPYGLAIRGDSAYVTTGSLAAADGQVIKIDL